jgi:uncharacterized membrane protein YeaQ/YmgE (transglycosylase-associated protein family)
VRFSDKARLVPTKTPKMCVGARRDSPVFLRVKYLIYMVALVIWMIAGNIAGQIIRGRDYGVIGNIALGLAGGIVGYMVVARDWFCWRDTSAYFGRNYLRCGWCCGNCVLGALGCG